MDFKFSEEEKIFRESVREFCQNNIAPMWVEMDEKRELPLDLYKRMAAQGLFGIPVKPEYGGSGGTLTMACIALEEIAYAEPSVAIPVYTLLQNGWPYALQLFGSEEAKQEILPKVCDGTGFYSIATTETQGGSDLAGIKMAAAKHGDKWILNGEKVYISGVEEVQKLDWGGGWFTLVRTGGSGAQGLTVISVLAKRDGKIAEGFEPSMFEEIGRGGLTTGGFKLTDFEVEDKYRVGEVNKGMSISLQCFNLARIVVAAACLGSARWALDQGIDYIKQRKLFGRMISSFQGISFREADLYMKLEAAKLFVYKAAWLADRIYLYNDPDFSVYDLNVPATIAKYWVPDTCAEIYQEVLKWFGAYGYTKECPLYRGWLGTWSYNIGAEGAMNVLKYIIARDTIGKEYIK